MKRLLPYVLMLALVGCGGKTPLSPTRTPIPDPAPAPANRNPVINSLTVNPTFAIAFLTPFTYGASASDPDGDTLTYIWDLAGNERSGSSGSITFSRGFTGIFRLTVTDGRGGSASDTRTVTCGSMTGTWRGTFASFIFTSNLTQSGGVVTGDYVDQDGPGRLDPSSANTINPRGEIVLRYKQSVFTDFTFRGTMDNTGRRITGGVSGSGLNNTPFVMTKQ